jgi:predicted dehydrogenase
MIKFAVIGCGKIAIKSSIPAILKSGLTEVAVCVDINKDVESIINERFGVPFESSLELALDNYSFDAVYISTPIGTHKDIICQVAKYKKHILCEKSLASNLAEVEEIIAVCKENKVALFEGFMYQFHTQHKFVHDVIKSGKIGEPFHFQAWFGFPPIDQNDFRYNKGLGGGALLDAGAYTVHSARHFFGEEPKNCYSILENEGYAVETRGTVMLDFGNSRTAHLVFGFNNMYQNQYKIWGTKGVLTINRAFALPPDFESNLTIETQGNIEEFTMEPCDHFIEEIKFFCQNYNSEKQRSKWLNEAYAQSVVFEKIITAI